MLFKISSLGPIQKGFMMSRRFRKILRALGALAVFAAVTVGALSTSRVQRALEHRVIMSLENLTGGRVEIGGMRINPALLLITFHDLTIRGSEVPPSQPLFSARTVVVRVNPISLLRRRLALRSLEWHDAVVHITTLPNGLGNSPESRTSSVAGQALEDLVDLAIDRATLDHTDIVWNDKRFPLTLVARNVGILLRSSRAQRYSGSLSCSTMTVAGPHWLLPPITFTARLEFSRTGLAVTSLDWQSAGLTGRSSLTLRAQPTPEGYLSVQARGEVPQLAHALGLPELESGNLNFEGQGIYRHGESSLRGRVQVHGLTIRSGFFRLASTQLSADYVADPRRVEVSNLVVSTFGGTAQGRAEILLRGASPVCILSAQLRGLDLPAALRTLSSARTLFNPLHLISKVDGQVNATWGSKFEDFKSDFKLKFHPGAGSTSGYLPLRGSAQGTAERARGFVVNFREAEFHTPQSTLRARGTLGVPTAAGNLAFRLVTSDFEEWRPLAQFLIKSAGDLPLSLKSPLSFSGLAFGSVGRPEIRGRIDAGAFDYRGWTWDSLAASIVAAPETVEVTSCRLQRGASALNMEFSAKLADWKLLPNAPVRFAARVERAPVGGLGVDWGVLNRLRGLATARLDLAGPASNLSGGGFLRIEQGVLAGEPFDSLSTSIHFADSNLTLGDLRLAKGRGEITGQMRVDPSRRTFSAELHGTDLDLAEFKPLGPVQAQATGPRALEGRASFDLRGEGTFGNVQLHSTWNIDAITLEGSAIGNLRGQLEWQGQQIRLQGEGEGPAGVFKFTGQAHAEGRWPLELTGQCENLRLDPWIRWLANRKFNAVVSARGSARLQGPLKDPRRFEVLGQAQNLEVSLPNLTWKNDYPINFRYADQVLTATRFRMRGPATDLDVEGSIRFGGPPTLSFIAQGQADAQLLSLVDPAVQAHGRTELKLRIGGSPFQPLLYGTLNVHDVSASYGDLPFRLSSLKGEIRLEGERAVAQSLRGVSGGGTVDLTGFATLAGASRYQVGIALDQVRVPYSPDFTPALNGNLRLTGTPERGQLSGELNVRQVFTQENFNLLGRLAQVGSPVGWTTPRVASPLASRIRLSVQVASAPPVRLETRDLRLLADIDLRLQGTLANPVEVGTIHFLSGEAIVRSNRYKINRGDISLTNPLRTQPVLDLEAQTRIQLYDLTLDLSGPFDRLKIAYRSDPPLPTADILSLLALGYSRQQQEMSTAAGHPLPALGATALLSEALSSQVTGRIKRLFGVSRIKIDPNIGGPGNVAGARVTVEQQVTRDFTLTYVTNTATTQQRVIQFEWTLSDNLSLVGVRDQNGIFGVEMKMHRRFK